MYRKRTPSLSINTFPFESRGTASKPARFTNQVHMDYNLFAANTPIFTQMTLEHDKRMFLNYYGQFSLHFKL